MMSVLYCTVLVDIWPSQRLACFGFSVTRSAQVFVSVLHTTRPRERRVTEDRVAPTAAAVLGLPTVTVYVRFTGAVIRYPVPYR